MPKAEFAVPGIKIDEKGNWGANVNGQLATTATDGFLQVVSMPGAPMGTATNFVGSNAFVFDNVNNKLWVNLGGNNWKSVTFT